MSDKTSLYLVFSRNLQRIIDARFKSNSEFGRAAGVPKSVVSRVLSGDPTHLKFLAAWEARLRAIDVEPMELFQGSQPTLTERERELIRTWRTYPPAVQEVMASHAQSLRNLAVHFPTDTQAEWLATIERAPEKTREVLMDSMRRAEPAT